MLKDILEAKKGFKLVCGAGNEDANEVEKLVTIYSKAGCNFFDVSANLKIVDAAKRGLKRAGIDKDRYLCVSVGIAGDPHITKAVIDTDKCVKCRQCQLTCPHEAIIYTDKFEVNKERCLGCGQCVFVCPMKGIKTVSQIQDYNEILPEIIEKGIDCIEFHAISTDEDDVMEKWQILNELYDGMLCISLDRSELGDKKLKERVKNLLEVRKPFTTIIQADGVAMSGNNDECGTTLQAIATAQMFENAKLSAYIMMSGGTNSKSIELSTMCGVEPHCLAVGSYARKIVKEYLACEDLYTNEQKMSEAVNIAKALVDTVMQRKV